MTYEEAYTRIKNGVTLERVEQIFPAKNKIESIWAWAEAVESYLLRHDHFNQETIDIARLEIDAMIHIMIELEQDGRI